MAAFGIQVIMSEQGILHHIGVVRVWQQQMEKKRCDVLP